MGDRNNLMTLAGRGIRWLGNHLLITLGVALLLLLLAFTTVRVVTVSGQEIVLSSIDTDLDGCSDEEELRFGMDPENPYDFFDVPPRDGLVNILDIGRVVLRFGSIDGNPNYYVGFDRSVQSDGSVGPPDGTINIIDIGLLVVQFGRGCTDLEWCNGNVQDLVPPEEEDEPLDGVTEETICYKIMDDGQVVDYVIVTNEVSVVLTGEELVDLSKESLPDEETVLQARKSLGLSGVAAASAATSTRFYNCESSKTWRDSFHVRLFKIKLHTDFRVLYNAGIYSGLVRVTNNWGSQGAWWPWQIQTVFPIRVSYRYTDNGPWDFRINVQKDVQIKAVFAGVVLRTRMMHFFRAVGPWARCARNVWLD